VELEGPVWLIGCPYDTSSKKHYGQKSDPGTPIYSMSGPCLGGLKKSQIHDFFEMGVESWNGSYAAKSGFLWPKKCKRHPGVIF
jgi:hypothetical protein